MWPLRVYSDFFVSECHQFLCSLTIIQYTKKCSLLAYDSLFYSRLVVERNSRTVCSIVNGEREVETNNSRILKVTQCWRWQRSFGDANNNEAPLSSSISFGHNVFSSFTTSLHPDANVYKLYYPQQSIIKHNVWGFWALLPTHPRMPFRPTANTTPRCHFFCSPQCINVLY